MTDINLEQLRKQKEQAEKEARDYDSQIQKLLAERDAKLPDNLFAIYPELRERSNEEIINFLQDQQRNANVGTIFLNNFPQFKTATSDQLQHLMEAFTKMAGKMNNQEKLDDVANAGMTDAEIASQDMPKETSAKAAPTATIDFPPARDEREKSGQSSNGLTDEDKQRAKEAINQKFDEMEGTEDTGDLEDDDSVSSKKRHSLFEKLVGKNE